MSRLGLGAAVLVVLVVTSGCTAFSGPTAVDDERLDESAPYDWDAPADVTINITATGEYHAVYTIENQSTFEVYRNDGFGNKRPIEVSAVRFRDPDGTIVSGSEMTVERTRSRTTFELPASDGKLAFTSTSPPKRFTTPVYRKGDSYEVILPRNRRTSNLLFGDVSPGGFETELIDQRNHYRWDSVEADTIRLRYYVSTDIQLFAVVFAIAGLMTLLIFGRIWRQVRTLQRQREEMGLDVDIEREDDGPPPGRR